MANSAVPSICQNARTDIRPLTCQCSDPTARIAVLGAVLLLLTACGGGGGGSSTASPGVPPDDGAAPQTPVKPDGLDDSYLFVSVPDYYFGTREVGSRTEQIIEVSNRGGDIYPISNIRMRGDDAEEFSTGVYSDMVLNPSEAVRLQVDFVPITDGSKLAELAFDFDTIVQATDQQNRNEQRYYEARDLERRGSYPAAENTYSDYVSTRPVTPNKQRAAIKVPVLREATAQGQSTDSRSDGFPQYLAALDARDSGDPDTALALIDSVLVNDANSYIADDALYLRGYIQLMDVEAPAAALTTLQELRSRFPDSTYYDTALYSEALANVALGNLMLARSIYEDLKYRHTGVDAFGISLPKDNLTSRLWFERATAGLAELGSA